MSPDSAAAIPAELIIAIVGLVGTLVGVGIKAVSDWWNKRDSNRMQVQLVIPQQIIDQYQEMNAQLQSQVSAQGTQIDSLNTRMATLEMKLGAYRDYAWLLREHITLRREPPAPDWPPGLP